MECYSIEHECIQTKCALFEDGNDFVVRGRGFPQCIRTLGYSSLHHLHISHLA